MVQTLFMSLTQARMAAFFEWLQKGVQCEARVECPIRDFLCDQIGLSPPYVEKRIQTVLLDGKAVDDVGSALIRDGSVLALSAALPGLAGALLRAGSPYAPMRSEISVTPDKKTDPSKEGMITLKIFNLLLGELGPRILKQGVRLEGKALQAFLKARPSAFWSGVLEMRLDGEKIDPADLFQKEWTDDLMLLRLED